MPFDRRADHGRHDPRRRAARRQARRHGRRSRSRASRRRRAARSAASLDVLGDIEEPGVDTEIIIRKYGITDVHGDDAVEEAKRLGGAVKEKDIKGRTDFRPITTVTIDGEHARDFDDAITIEKLPNGNYWLGVHIADVAHYVPEGSALDEEAYERGTSVYFPERAVHMFPSELSTGLCSLNPNVDRLVQTCLMEIDRQRRRRPLRDPRRRDPQRRADDLHGRQRHPDGSRSGADEEVRADFVPMFETMQRAVRDPEPAGASAAARSTST